MSAILRPFTEPLLSLAEFNEFCEATFLDHADNVRAIASAQFLHFECDCCQMKIEGIIIGQAFTNTPKNSKGMNDKGTVIMIAGLKKKEVRVYLVQDGCLFDHCSFDMKQTAEFASWYRRPFHLLADKSRGSLVEPVVKYCLLVNGVTDVLDKPYIGFAIDLRNACRSARFRQERRAHRMASRTAAAEPILRSKYASSSVQVTAHASTHVWSLESWSNPPSPDPVNSTKPTLEVTQQRQPPRKDTIPKSSDKYETNNARTRKVTVPKPNVQTSTFAENIGISDGREDELEAQVLVLSHQNTHLNETIKILESEVDGLKETVDRFSAQISAQKQQIEAFKAELCVDATNTAQRASNPITEGALTEPRTAGFTTWEFHDKTLLCMIGMLKQEIGELRTDHEKTSSTLKLSITKLQDGEADLSRSNDMMMAEIHNIQSTIPTQETLEMSYKWAYQLNKSTN